VTDTTRRQPFGYDPYGFSPNTEQEWQQADGLLSELKAWDVRESEALGFVPDEVMIASDTHEQREVCGINPGGVAPMVGIGFRCLTWEGDNFVDSVRDDAIWHEAEEGAKKAGSLSLELLGALAKGLIKKIEQHTGVNLDI
jgi:hypothetical protein